MRFKKHYLCTALSIALAQQAVAEAAHEKRENVSR